MAKKLTNIDKVLRILKKYPDINAADVALKMNCSRQYAYVLMSDARKRMAEEVPVEVPDPGVYLTEEEKEAINADVKEIQTWLSAHDAVNHPTHYTSGGVETIDFIEAKGLNYHLGNVVKYVTRVDLKSDPLQDLKKARWYLNREIERREKHA